jgi:hypothetical protein
MYTDLDLSPCDKATMDKAYARQDVHVPTVNQKRRRLCDHAASFLEAADVQSETSSCLHYFPKAKARRLDTDTTITTIHIDQLPPSSLARRQAQAPEPDETNINSIPQEIFLKIISFIGPASSSLLSIAQVSKRHSALMAQVGDAMLTRAQSNFRVLLPKLHPMESYLSLCIRHVRCCHDIQKKCTTLKQGLDKDFLVGCCLDTLVRGNVNNFGLNEVPSSPNKAPQNDTKATANESITMKEIDDALNLSLELLGADTISYFMANRPMATNSITFLGQKRSSIIQHCSTALEYQVLALCGRCGGKVFKYMKLRNWLRNEGTNVTSLFSDIVERWKDEERMDRARLIMQLVLSRDLELSRFERANHERDYAPQDVDTRRSGLNSWL